MSTAREVGEKLVQLCKANKNLESIDTLYSKDIVSVEAGAPNGGDRESRGIEAVRAKNKWWTDTHEIHKAEVFGPYPHGDDKFAVRFVYDVTHKPNKQRFTLDEVAVFHLQDGKVVREEFFYGM